MRLFSQLKLIPVCLVFLLLISLVLVGVTRSVAKASQGQKKTSGTASTCGSWSLATMPSTVSADALNGVKALSATDVWAVGDSLLNGAATTLIDHWDGATWSVVPSPNAPGTNTDFLSGVTATSANSVWAVGYYSLNSSTYTLTEKWNGKHWSIVSSPNVTSANELNKVARVPATNQLWAVGWYQDSSTKAINTLIEHWDGTAWSVVPSPNISGANGSSLNSVTALSATNAWVVGTSNSGGLSQTLIEHWDGGSWSIIPSPNAGTYTSGLESITAIPGTNKLWAVGTYIAGNEQPLTEYWNGTRWSIIFSPGTGTSGSSLSEVIALSAKNVWAVGTYQNSFAPSQTLIEHWDGGSWNIVSSPSPGSNGNLLTAISRVPGTTQLWAVGFHDTASNRQPLLESYC